jgi:hypothetical protein
MNSPTRTLLGQVAHDFGRNHNPFIRHIVRRTRQYLEDTIDPATGEPYLKPVRVRLFGEGEAEAVPCRRICRTPTTRRKSFVGCSVSESKGPDS